MQARFVEIFFFDFFVVNFGRIWWVLPSGKLTCRHGHSQSFLANTIQIFLNISGAAGSYSFCRATWRSCDSSGWRWYCFAQSLGVASRRLGSDHVTGDFKRKEISRSDGFCVGFFGASKKYSQKNLWIFFFLRFWKMAV